MNYTITEKDNGITEIEIQTDGEWGSIIFSYENSNEDFINAVNAKGIEAFIELLIADPNTAYLLFING